jgi:hypothetical protein
MHGEMLLIYLIVFLVSLDMLGLAPLMAPYARAAGGPDSPRRMDCRPLLGGQPGGQPERRMVGRPCRT